MREREEKAKPKRKQLSELVRDQLGWELNEPTCWMLAITATIIMLVVSYMIIGNWGCILTLPAIIVFLYTTLFWVGNRRHVGTDDELARVLKDIIAEMQAGTVFFHAFSKAAEEAEEPLKKDLMIAYRDMSMNESQIMVINNLYMRVPSPGMQQLSFSFAVAARSGSQESIINILKKVVESIERRQAFLMNLKGRANSAIVSILIISAFVNVLYMFGRTVDMLAAQFQGMYGAITGAILVMMGLGLISYIQRLSKIQI